jgi:sterol desaturase/sphingolipid hydroxylase (fatty acid hydroxylase superfamily)
VESTLEQRLEIVAAGAFYGAIIVFALLERVWPRRQDAHSFLVRWTSNISLLLIELGLVRIVIPGGLVVLAYLAEANEWGLLNALALPGLLTVVASVLLLDFLKYWEHRLVHRLPLLWRLHVVHHADLDVDFTTTFRHHPLEVAFSLVVSGAAILLFGLSPLGVLLFTVLASVVATLSHANIRWNPTADRMLRLVFMTRDAHAVHHSALREETDSNFGLVFIWWDRLFGTYRKAPAGGLDDYEVGVEHFRTSRDLALDRVLTMPFHLPGQPRARSAFGSVDHSKPAV